MTVACKDCRFASFRRTASGRLKKASGNCHAPLPAHPTMLCINKPIHVTKNAIWPDYAGQCDLFQPIEQTDPD